MQGENTGQQTFEISDQRGNEPHDWIECLEDCTRRTAAFKERLIEKLSIQSEKWQNFVAVPLPVNKTRRRPSNTRCQQACLSTPPRPNVSSVETSTTTSNNLKPMENEAACNTPPNRMKLFVDRSDATQKPAMSEQSIADETTSERYGQEDWDFPDEFGDGPIERLNRSILIKALGAEA